MCFLDKAFIYELQRRSVVRMDILPQSHSLNIQKVGAFGTIYNKVIRIDDLEHVDYMELEKKGITVRFYDRELLLEHPI